MPRPLLFVLAVAFSSTLLACSAEESPPLAMNDLQAIGSHNSYKQAIPPGELAAIAGTSPDLALSLDYSHLPLAEQLDMGMRQIELDVYYDPDGGRYAAPLLPKMVSGGPEDAAALSGLRADLMTDLMAIPGFKVLHVQDIDVRSSCATLVLCLSEIKAWSEAHDAHVPILIMMNAKDEPIALPGAVVPLRFDEAAWDALDTEVLSVFGEEKIVQPDDVRRGAKSLRAGLLAHGWPALETARGKVFFALDEGPEKVASYLAGHPSLEGRVFFVNSISQEADHAAYFTLNDPKAQGVLIRDAVAAGFIVRTRADADTAEARRGDISRLEAALASGAQYISTDYYLPRADFGPYQVALPEGTAARCNPVRREETCGLVE